MDQPVETINIITSTNNNHSNVNAESDSDTINIYMKEYIRKRIININGTEYYKQDGKLRKIIKDKNEQIKLINAAHSEEHERIYKTYYKSMRLLLDEYEKRCHKLY